MMCRERWEEPAMERVPLTQNDKRKKR